MQKYHNNTLVAEEQPSEIITQQQKILNAAEIYIAEGFALVPIPFGKKAPALIGWNKRTNTITSPDQIERLRGRNIGLAHAYSGTSAIDIDDYVKAELFFSDNGFNLPELLKADDAVQIQSGRQNRSKLLYRTNKILSTFKHAEGRDTVVEFRCATASGLTVQDVLPPSIHPETGKPYTWQGDFNNLPMLPVEIRDYWLQQNRFGLPPECCKDEKTHRRNITSVGVPNPTPQLDSIKSKAEARNLFQTQNIQRQILDILGFTDFNVVFKTGRATVRSVVPPYDKNKSGGLIRSDNGEILFHDFSGACGNQHVPLQVLYARLIAGHFARLTPTEKDSRTYGAVTLAVWGVRLLVDAGIVKPAAFDLPPCPSSRKSVTQFYEGMKRLFEVRWAFTEHTGNPVAMGRHFMSAWCGLTEDQARDAIKDLLKAGVIHTAGQHGRARLFAPGYKSPQKPKGRTKA